MNNTAAEIFSESVSSLKSVFSEIQTDSHFMGCLAEVTTLLVNSFNNRQKILLCGNGGSAAECQHMAAEYLATLNAKNMRSSLPAIAITTDTSFLTAWTNDFNTNEVFSRQVEGLSAPGDILMAYSTSGNSENIIQAVKTSRKMGLKTVAFLGNDGGRIAQLADYAFVVPSTSTPRIQEIHTLIGHSICRAVELGLGFD